MHDVTLLGHPDHGRGDIKRTVTQLAAFATDHGSALCTSGFQRVLHIAERLVVDQWAYQGLLVEGAAHR
ncbi:Uncharacterised protein [Mycobacteroides abscessus subsp. abscessus]|nr:Uncharacterised protein [Mycobacteroides abscessus subsp. abscessus]